MRAFLIGVSVLVVAAVLAVLWLPELVSSPAATTSVGGAAPALTAGGTTPGAPSAGASAADEPAARRVAAATVAAAERLHGTVTGPDGLPRAGATVTAACSDADEYGLLDREHRPVRRVVATATTDAAGTFSLHVAPGRHHVVRVEAAGCAPAARGGCQAGARVDVRLELAAALGGSVRDEAGLPVPDTRIVVRQPLGHASLQVGIATTDARGEFRLDGLPPGDVNVDVQPRTLAAPRDADVTLRAGTTTRHDVVLLAGVTIRGVVRDAATKAPIPDAEIGEGVAGRTVRGGADGTFVFVGFGAHHNVALRVRADGYPEREVAVRRRGGGPETTARDVEVLLARGFAARGRVADARGAPLADVYVAAAAADQDGDGGWGFRSDWRSARTAADGTFTIVPLRADMSHELLLLHPGHATAVYAFPPANGARTDVDLGELRLQPGASLRGTVVDERGEPVPGHAVELIGHNADRWRLASKPEEPYRPLDSYVAERSGRTEDRGRFHFADVAAGDHVVAAPRFASHEPERIVVTVPAGGDVNGVTLRLYRGLELGGQVSVSDGGTLPKVYCSIDPEDGQATSGDVEVAGDGRFRASGLAPGNYKLSFYAYASDSDRARGRIVLNREVEHVGAGSLAVQVELRVHGWVSGRVVGSDQAPLADAIVLVRDGDAVVDWTGTDAEGRFTMEALPSRPLRVFVLPRRPEPGAPIDVANALASADTQAGAPPIVLVVPSR